MAVSKVNIDGITIMDATKATAQAVDISSSKTAMLANGEMTAGIGSGEVVVTETQNAQGTTIVSIDTGRKIVKFIDYDGTVVATRTKDEIDAMTSDSDLPANPTHTGLTAQGWNWTVTQLKAQLTAMPNQDVIVGQMYITSSGKTEIDVVMPEGRLSPIMTIYVNGTVSIDWGDETTPDTVTGTSLTTRLDAPHTYTSAGSYTIKISLVSGAYTFYGSSSYTLLRKSTSQNENRVYANCIQHIRLGSGITSIDSNAFINCSSLATITIPNGVTSIGSSSVFSACYSLVSVTIPSGVTSIGGSTFQNCYSLVSIAIPSGVTSIGTSVFYYCYSLTNITIPSGVTSIMSNAFQNCYSLASITIPSGVTSIGGSAFYGCYSLTSIIIPSGVTSIGNNTFYNCYSLTSVTIPSGVTSIGDNAFYGCYSITSITIPSSVTSIGSNAFQNCTSIANVIIPSGVTSIGGTAFQNCSSLASITIPSSVTSIGSNAFNGCFSLASITIPSGVTSIGEKGFNSCYSLASITIPSGVTSIGTQAFNSCYGMAEYHFKSTTPPTLSNTNAFSSIASDCIMYVPYSSDHSVLTAYQTASNWSTYASYMQEEV